MKLLMTGGTGFLGSELVSLLAPQYEKIYLVCRKPSKRIEALYKDFPSVVLVKGDISGPDIIEEAALLKEIRENVEVIFHGAAYYDIEGPYSSCFMYNVVGTQNLLYLASQCEKLKSIHYVSTIAVAGNFKGVFSENQLEEGQKFNNHYAKTKYDAEQMVRNYKFAGAIHIYRLGILIGNSITGKMTKTDGPYYFLRLLKKIEAHGKKINLLRYLPLPFNESATMPLLPVDDAAKVIAKGMSDPEEEGVHCYHVISKGAPLVKNFIEDSLKAFSLKLNIISLPRSPIYKFILPKVGLPSELLLYMYGGCTYSTEELDKKFLDVDRKAYAEYSDVFYGYAKRMFD